MTVDSNSETLAAQPDAQGSAAPAADPKASPAPKSGFLDMITGDDKQAPKELMPHLPSEIIGGSVPYIPGTEEEAVWNAATQACGTERVHYVYAVDTNRIWYIATPSSSLASHPDTWCPLVAALPGKSEFWDKETVYLYEQEGVSSALRWDPDTNRMQVFLGPSRTVLPKVQSMDANFVTINAEMAEAVPWRNHGLRIDQMARAAARMLLLSGIFATFCALCFIAVLYVQAITIQPNLEKAKTDTLQATSDLTRQAQQSFENDAIRHMIRIQELLDALLRVEGTLVKYQVNGSTVQWEALVHLCITKTLGK